MDQLADGLVTVFNGAWATVTSLTHPGVAGLLVLAGGLAWMARLELDELDRHGTKPTVERH